MSKIGNMTIRKKFLTAFLLMSVIAMALGITGILSISGLTQMSRDLEELQIESQGVVKALNSHYIWRQELMEAIMKGSRFTGSLDPQTCGLGKWLENDELVAGADEKILALREEILPTHEFIHSEAGFIQNQSPDNASAHLLNVLLPKTQEVITIFTEIENRYIELIGEKTFEIIDTGRNLNTYVIAFVVVAVLAGLILSLVIPPIILKPLNILSSVMNEASEGDFTVRLPSDYGGEIGELFAPCNSLLEINDTSVMNLRETAVNIRESAQNILSISSNSAENSINLKEQVSSVSSVTEEFSAGMTQASNSLSTASSHISAVASSIDEINSTVSVIAAAAEETSTIAVQSSSLVDSIQDSISKASDSVSLVSKSFNSVAQSVNEINKSISVVSEHCRVTKNKMSDADDKAKNTNTIIHRLEEASKQIGKIVNVISDIADQTNMLALNAAIEAAGAGEAGKGFMVVANEVKELAKQTADSTDEIADQIESIQKYMPEAVSAVSEITAITNEMIEFLNSLTQEVTQQGNRSDKIADDSAAAARRMSEITAEINRISENSLSVTKTVIESTKGANEIAQSISELVIGTQEIAMNSERASNNIKEIDKTTKEITSGLVDISRNIHLIDEEAGEVLEGAETTKLSSEKLLTTANDLEEFISKFKIS